MKKKVIKAGILLFTIFIISIWIVFAQTDKAKIRDLLSRLETGWETKDPEKLKTCFTRLPSLQTSMYKYLFSITGKIILDIEIKEIAIYGSFANVKAHLKKEIIYSPGGTFSSKEVRNKELQYILGKKNGEWYILGTVDPSLAKIFNRSGKIRVTEKNYQAINKIMEQIPESDRKRMYSNFTGPRKVSKEKSLIKWASMGTLIRYKAVITTEKLQDTGEGGGEIMWESDITFNQELVIPQDIIEGLVKGKIYYLNIYGYDTKGVTVGIGLRQIIRE